MGPVLPIGLYPKNVVYSFGNIRGQMAIHVSDIISRMPSYHLSYHKNLGLSCSPIYKWKQSSSLFANCFQVQRGHLTPYSAQSLACFSSLTLRSIVGTRCHRWLICSCWMNKYEKMKLRLLVPEQGTCKLVPFYGRQHNFVVALFVVLFTFCSISQIAYAKAPKGFGKREFYCENFSSDYTHTKPVLKNYSIIGIPGDGRCLFRSVAHGACVRSGKPAPSQSHQMDLADNLRSKVADEFIKRRKETEWFIEGDFDTYVSNIRKPHVWGGEPELLMASHVLEMPITVYMHDEDAGGLISIAEYGQEYGKHDPIRVLFHGYGHYDAIHIPSSSL